MAKRIIQVPVTMGIPKRLKDGSVKLEFTTKLEINTEEYMVMDTYRQSQGWMLFRENEFSDEDVPTEDVDTEIGKSQATQVRDALWVLFKTKGNDIKDKEAWLNFYRKQSQAYKTRILDEVHLIEEG